MESYKDWKVRQELQVSNYASGSINLWDWGPSRKCLRNIERVSRIGIALLCRIITHISSSEEKL
jgi:hypothetical protein